MKHRAIHKSRSSRLERRILVVIALYSIGSGIWGNFRQLWLQDNGFSAHEVGTLLSIGTAVSVVGILWIGRHVKMSHLKSALTLILILKLCLLFILANLNNTGYQAIIAICTILDIFLACSVLSSFYPLLTIVVKSNTAYSRRKLVEYLFCDLGILVGGIMLGQEIAGHLIDYNSCLIMTIFFLTLSIVALSSFQIKVTHHEVAATDSMVRYICRNRIHRNYMIYVFLSSCSFAAALGLKILTLTGHLQFSDNAAMNYSLAVGLMSDVIGILALKRFTPKNDYLTLTLKFGLRLIAYVIAILAGNAFIFLLAITWSILVSTSYENVTDGYYINAIDNRHQMSYNAVRYVVVCLGEALGLYFCGLTFDLGLEYMLGLSAAIMVVQLAVAYYLIYLRHRRHTKRHSASRLRYDERVAEE